MIHDGLISENSSDVVMLTRSAWAGMQRWGAALWSGDTASTFPSLKVSVQAGLNTQMSGIYWWTTDIGVWDVCVGCLVRGIRGCTEKFRDGRWLRWWKTFGSRIS
jgi:hypothetical protein